MQMPISVSFLHIIPTAHKAIEPWIQALQNKMYYVGTKHLASISWMTFFCRLKFFVNHILPIFYTFSISVYKNETDDTI